MSEDSLISLLSGYHCHCTLTESNPHCAQGRGKKLISRSYQKNGFKLEWLNVFYLFLWESKSSEKDKQQMQPPWWVRDTNECSGRQKQRRGGRDRWIEGESLCWIAFTDSSAYNWCQNELDRVFWVTSLFNRFNRPHWCLMTSGLTDVRLFSSEAWGTADDKMNFVFTAF